MLKAITDVNNAVNGFVWGIVGLILLIGTGILMTCLESAPERRRKGIAQALLRSVFELLRQQGCRFVYVHINKKNRPSLALHNKLGFRVIADSARLADGTVSQDFFTMKSDI